MRPLIVLVFMLVIAFKSYGQAKVEHISYNEVCINGIKYYKIEDNSSSFSKKGRGWGYMSVAIHRMTGKPIRCKMKGKNDKR